MTKANKNRNIKRQVTDWGKHIFSYHKEPTEMSKKRTNNQVENEQSM